MHPITAIHPIPPITFSFVVVGLFVTLIFIAFSFIFMVVLLSSVQISRSGCSCSDFNKFHQSQASLAKKLPDRSG
jgi:hypothetical protein